MEIKLMNGENEIWRVKAKKEIEQRVIFPLNIIKAIFSLLSGNRTPGELVFTNKRVVFLYKRFTFFCIPQEESVEYTMLSTLQSISAGIKYGFLCFCKNLSVVQKLNLYLSY